MQTQNLLQTDQANQLINQKEVILNPASGVKCTIFGWTLIILGLSSIVLAVFKWELFFVPIILVSIGIFALCGVYSVDPASARILVLWGTYRGTVKSNGLFWINPFYNKRTVSLKIRVQESPIIKVNDKTGSPINIGIIVIWTVEDTYLAQFNTQGNFEGIVRMQSEAALRQLATQYPYDTFDDHDDESLTLRGGSAEVRRALESEMRQRLKRFGLKLIEARIFHLSYAPEIATLMLKRQEATAVVAARNQIVSGAVGMVELALERLESKNTVQFSQEQKASTIQNMLTILVAEQEAPPRRR